MRRSSNCYLVFVVWLAALAGSLLSSPAASFASDWHALGPVNMPSFEPSMGRVNAVTMHPTDSQTLFLCSASGGLWSSADAGHTWQPRTDGLPVLGTSGLVIDPLHPNIFYLATGDADAMDTPSIGVWKSLDSGTNWSATGLSWSQSADNGIYKLVMHPTNPNRLFAATTDGIYSSADGAASWQRQTPDNLTIWYDIVFQPGNPAVLYAVSQQARFYRSVDTGATWQSVTAGLPSGTSVERSTLAVSVANPNGVYLLCSSALKSDFFGLYRSTNGGTSFLQRASSATPTIASAFGTQGFYDSGVAVSPFDFNLVYVAGVNVVKSIDGGTTWTNVQRGASSGNCHVDFHALQFFGGTLYACTDGGLHRTSDGTLNWEDLSASLQISQVYRVGNAAQNPYLMYVGTQDNGLNQLKNGQWSHLDVGDFSEAVVDFTDEKVVYAVGNGVLSKSTDAWRTSAPLTISTTENNFTLPVVMHPTDHLTLYAGLANVFRTSNAGTTWQRLSNFPDVNTLCRRISQAISNPNFIYVTRGANIWRTSDGGLSWTNMTHNLPGVGPLTSVAVSSSDPNNVWVTQNTFYNGGPKVFHSTNGGGTWSDYTGSLPNLPINTIVYEGGSNDGLYVGMEPGVFYRDTSMTDWQPFMSNLPKVKITELEVHSGSLKLRAATYGRGLWETYLAGAAPLAPVITGPALAPINRSTAYTFTPVTKAIGYQCRQSRLLPFTLTDGAENGLTNFTALVSTNYPVLQNTVVASGSFAFHLAHGLPTIDQTLTLNALLRPRTNAQVQFKSRLGTSTAAQIANLQVSTNQGITWQSVYAQTGNSTGENSFSTRIVGLGNYLGTTVQIRFNYTLGPGNYFSQTSKGFGWYIDDITCTGFDQLSQPTLTDVPGTNFNFTIAQTGDYLLEARAKVFGPFYMDFGPAKLVTMVSTPLVQITSIQPASVNTWNINFSLLGGTTSGFQLFKADGLSGLWTQDTGAIIQTITAGSTYRAVTTSTAPQRYYRVKTQ